MTVGVNTCLPPPPPPDQSDHRGEKRNLPLGGPSLVHKLVGPGAPPPPPLLSSHVSLPPGLGAMDLTGEPDSRLPPWRLPRPPRGVWPGQQNRVPQSSPLGTGKSTVTLNAGPVMLHTSCFAERAVSMDRL